MDTENYLKSQKNEAPYFCSDDGNGGDVFIVQAIFQLFGEYIN